MSGCDGAPVALQQSRTIHASTKIVPEQIGLSKRFVKVPAIQRNVKKSRKEKHHLKIVHFAVEKP
jgi:hypothetical protein